MQYDLIIIGSGSVGAAAGYYARRAGLNVLMTDAHQPPHQEGSHHGSSRLIRHAYGEGEKYVPLVLRAQQLWDELAEISGEAVFERTGVINLGPASSAFLANVAASARAFQLEVEELDAQAVMQRWPEIRLPDDYRAIFEPASGVLRSELAVETWIRLAREAGCAQLFNCPVSAIHHHADGITIDTLDGEYHGKKLLVSAKHLGHPPASGPPYPAGTQGVRLVPGRWPLQQQESLPGLHLASCPTAINITVSRRKIMN
ncbi:N-methyl-L-tryptophan oxidase [Klebsiella pneumoniae]